jgi:DNA polymerase-3 subunit beta
MKIKILKMKLKEGLGIVNRLIIRRLPLPILENTLFETEKNFLKLISTNLESGIIWWGLSKIEEEGKVCINGRFLENIISAIQEETINLRKKDFDVLVENKGLYVKIKGVNPEEFPLIPSINKYEKIVLSSKELCQGLSKIFYIPSPSLGRPEIAGIYFLAEKNILKLVATDSFRLAEIKIPFKTSLNKVYSFILPQNAAREIVGIFGNKEGEINLYFSPNQVFFEYLMEEISHPEILYTSRLIEGEYPNYQEIIPKKFKTKVYLDKAIFLNQIKIASSFKGRMNEVKLKISPKEKRVEVFTQNPDVGEYQSQIDAEVEGEAMEISFNYRFLTDGISNLEGKKVEFSLSDGEGPAILKSSGIENYFYILMPIKAS